MLIKRFDEPLPFAKLAVGGALRWHTLGGIEPSVHPKSLQVMYLREELENLPDSLQELALPNGKGRIVEADENWAGLISLALYVSDHFRSPETLLEVVEQVGYRSQTVSDAMGANHTRFYVSPMPMVAVFDGEPYPAWVAPSLTKLSRKGRVRLATLPTTEGVLTKAPKPESVKRSQRVLN